HFVAIRPAVFHTEAAHHRRQVFDIRGATDSAVGVLKYGPLLRIFEVQDVATEFSESERILNVIPGHAARREQADVSGHDDFEISVRPHIYTGFAALSS